MRARLAKKIVKASPLYHEYCFYFHKKKQCKQLYWMKKYRNLWCGWDLRLHIAANKNVTAHHHSLIDEIAATNLFTSVRLFPFMWNGMMQGKSVDEGRIMQGNKKLNEKRIHPTQKPVALYTWLLTKFAKEKWSILDTHIPNAGLTCSTSYVGEVFTATPRSGAYTSPTMRIQSTTHKYRGCAVSFTSTFNSSSHDGLNVPLNLKPYFINNPISLHYDKTLAANTPTRHNILT